MADEKDAKPASDKASKAKPKARAKKAAGKGAAKPAGKKAAKKAAAKKPAAKGGSKKAAPKKAGGGSGARSSAKAGAKKAAGKGAKKPRLTSLDKSVAQLRDSLEHSVTLSRERIQEVVDDAVKRGRMTHGDAEKMIGELLKRGRKQTDALLTELEKLVRQARRKLPS